jgi:hypothetical protein
MKLRKGTFLTEGDETVNASQVVGMQQNVAAIPRRKQVKFDIISL